ncbi:DUF2188 domain-containing protein [Enterococcus pallens]|uniref:DUF2188 domain-containing protein n=1 Tax=Enterococcus pallens ATCC BAA-351 TaxID=1158607 RepID=R2Q9P7_9ENTE|nr:DUF2188 domain-containing protein [Enterococcus pallens]EOH93167.1 hypothetical protein UAU_02810 [Enterococcus pallens ATCC BAA-351]EOU24953.1 hypothetical protein I588_00941 [Enterococcus pallens ATCC BAA-351]OJG76686.1 hypothetical protein RV10_GL003286 [Enterococcus pallens]
MPWNMKDYPASMKNLEKVTRKKAIDIGNALLADGYPEERAIPIAISQAEKWYEDASDQEIQQAKKAKNPQKNDKHETNPNTKKLINANVSVKYQDDQWEVISDGAEHASERFAKKSEAIQRGKAIAENKQSELKIFKRDGTLQETQNFKAN